MADIPKRPLQINTSLVPAIFYTSQFKIIGYLHIPPGGRISDFLNKTVGGQAKDTFLSITDATCYPINGGEAVHNSSFLSVHKDHIHLVVPLNTEKKP